MAADPFEHLARLTITLICEQDEQGHFLTRELQRTRARVNIRWPIPDRIGENTDIVVCEFIPDLSGRFAWAPGEATAATIVLLSQGGRYDLRSLRSAVPDSIIHRPYTASAISTALSIGWDHFTFNRRQKGRIDRLDENIRSMRDIERAKQMIMTKKSMNERNAFGLLRSMAMERRQTIAALATSLVDHDRDERQCGPSLLL
jgi:two-component system, response regulator / RNA-binding antiterminator